mgnify:CR=1 FL=1
MSDQFQVSGILLYDNLSAKGGAEKLSFSIFNGIKNTDFCVSSKDERLFPDGRGSGYNGNLYTLSSYTSIRGWKSLKTILSFISKKVFRKSYDWAIYSGDYAPIAILKNRQRAKRNILYCHTIPRSPYDLRGYKLAKMGLFKGLAFRLMCLLVKSLYEPSIRKMDVVVANSENVRNRIKKYIGIDAIVINPPIDTDRFKWLGQEDYYLSLARLEPEKRVDLVVRAFMKMPDKKLVVASGGSEFARLVDMAKGYKNITFLGWASDEDIYKAVGNCIATIYIPIDEDFGMSPVESMSAGKPVLGAAEGGLLETIVNGKTGVLLDRVSIESISRAIQIMSKDKCLEMRKDAEERAKNYSESMFLQKIETILGGESNVSSH